VADRYADCVANPVDESLDCDFRGVCTVKSVKRDCMGVQAMSDDKKSGADVLSLIQGNASADQFAETLRTIEKGWPREVQMAELCARLLRLRYDALKAKGFTDAQSLQAAMKWMWP
jgi:hypothetical protein